MGIIRKLDMDSILSGVAGGIVGGIIGVVMVWGAIKLYGLLKRHRLL